MNETDSERIMHIFFSNGFFEADSPLCADVIILNSCSVREKAEQKMMSLLGRMLKQKRLNPALRVGLCGCTVQKDPDAILRKFPGLDFAFGTFDIPECFEIYEKSLDKPCYEISPEPHHSLDKIRNYSRRHNHKAFVTIMEGCDNFCSYCIIPYVRGRERSRPAESILKEIEMLIQGGAKEITLLGQNVNSYSYKGLEFPGLLEEIALIDGLSRLRFITSHPRDTGEKLFTSMSRHENICRSIHLPFQSGSDRILCLMNRGYTHDGYLGKVEILKDYISDIVITTDVIVGFPGETEQDFNDTMRMIEEVRFWGAFSFRYSIRYPSKAALMDDDVPENEKLRRLYMLQKRQNEITMDYNREFVGKSQRVLVDGKSKKSPDFFTGKNEYNITVNFRTDNTGYCLSVGDFADVRIERYSNSSLIGSLL